jgi:hypothetical protein
MESIYRFRPTKALLDGYHELERQEIVRIVAGVE